MHAATLVKRTANQALRLRLGNGAVPGSPGSWAYYVNSWHELAKPRQTRKRQAVRTGNDKWGTESFFISKPECALPINVAVAVALTIAIATMTASDDSHKYASVLEGGGITHSALSEKREQSSPTLSFTPTASSSPTMVSSVGSPKQSEPGRCP
jgi:hypothetical protein